MAKSNENKSLPKTKTLHGVEIKKMPCGKYFEALQTIKDLPEDFTKELTKDIKDFKLSEMMSVEGITELVMRLFVMLPDFFVKVLAKLIGIEENRIINELTPLELAEIIKEFSELNDLESFFQMLKSAASKIITLTGFKKSLLSALKSE